MHEKLSSWLLEILLGHVGSASAFETSLDSSQLFEQLRTYVGHFTKY